MHPDLHKPAAEAHISDLARAAAAHRRAADVRPERVALIDRINLFRDRYAPRTLRTPVPRANCS